MHQLTGVAKMRVNRVIISSVIDDQLNQISRQRKEKHQVNRSKQDIIAELVRKLHKKEVKL